ncbi:MAG: HTTM domain-containing protein [Proteobacteria bacterium]|nr:HTTM domain-containing protein [Pseudomonadota bacterium]MCP4916980.1 HTTM domain-containing protein [Pseudomonadota bacterium]
MTFQQLWFQPGSDDRADALRFGFFAVLAIDIWQGISHLARYGAGHFNVSHFAGLDGLIPVPDKAWMVGIALIQIVLAVRAALGVQLRVTVPALTLLYGASYYWSQLDSYQHHYLITVLLLIVSGGLWLDGDGKRIPAWTLRLMMAVLSIMYLWAAITKVDPEWLGGKTLGAALVDDDARIWVKSLAASLDVGHMTVLSWASWAAMIGEVVLAVGLLWPKTRRVCWALGLAFHVGVEIAALRIGLFSYFMVGLYLLYAPEVVCSTIARGVHWLERRGDGSWAGAVEAALLTGGALVFVPLPGARVAAVVVAALVLANGRITQRQVLVHALAGLFVVGCHVGTDVTRDYYKYWGGDTRRRGPVPEAIEAYENVVELDPTYTSGHLRLGDLYERAGRSEEALDEWRAALDLEPDNSAARDRLQRVGASL